MSEAWNSSRVLVHRADDGRLEVEQSTLSLLDGIQSPVQVISMVGPYRTGKSYLLNYIATKLTGRENVFPVDNTIQASTRGIHVWCCPHPSSRGLWLIFLDMEGLSDVGKGDRENDIHIFVLAVLLSSSLIYNSRGVIDMDSLEILHHVSYLADRVRVMSREGEDLEDFGFDLAFPEFIWVVRDFHLSVEHNGRKVTDDGYLEKSLSTSNPALSDRKTKQNSIKRCIKEYFPKRKCFLFPNLQQLDSVSSETKAKCSVLIEQILSGNCKMHEGSEVTGRVFGKLAAELVSSVQNPDKPIEVQSIMGDIAKKENAAAIEKSFDRYCSHMNENTAEAVDEVKLHQIHLRCCEDATTLFLQNAVFPVDSFYVELMNSMNKEFERISHLNAAKIKDLCDKTFQDLRQKVIGGSISKYLCPGGFQRYREDMTEIRKRWESLPILQGTVWRYYFMEKLKQLGSDEARMIMNADNDMTALKREEEENRRERQRHEMEEIRKRSETIVKKDQVDFKQKMDTKLQSMILRPQEEQISRLQLRIDVLERQLSEQDGKMPSSEEAESCEHRLNMYRRILKEKRDEPSRWQKVSTSIRSFVSDAFGSICHLFEKPEFKTAVHSVTTAAAASVVGALSSTQSPSSVIIAGVATQALSAALQPLKTNRGDQEKEKLQ